MLVFSFGSICSSLFLCVTALHILNVSFSAPYWVFVISYVVLVMFIVLATLYKKHKNLVGFAGFDCIAWCLGDFIALLLAGELPTKTSLPKIIDWSFFANIIWFLVLLLSFICVVPVANRCARVVLGKKNNPNPQKALMDRQKGAVGGAVGGILAISLLTVLSNNLKSGQLVLLICVVLFALIIICQIASISFLIYHRILTSKKDKRSFAT